MARGRDVSLRMRVDTAQRITVVLDRSGNGLSDQSSQSAEHVAVICTTEEPEHLPQANDHERRKADFVVLEVQARHPGRCDLPQSVSGEDWRQSHCQEASGDREIQKEPQPRSKW